MLVPVPDIVRLHDPQRQAYSTDSSLELNICRGRNGGVLAFIFTFWAACHRGCLPWCYRLLRM